MKNIITSGETGGKFSFHLVKIAPDKKKHVINLYFQIKIIKNSIYNMKLGDERNLTDLKFITKEEIENIKLYPNIKTQLIQLLNEEKIAPYLGLLWDK